MVTRSVRVAKKGKGKGKVSVKALLLSAAIRLGFTYSKGSGEPSGPSSRIRHKKRPVTHRDWTRGLRGCNRPAPIEPAIFLRGLPSRWASACCTGTGLSTGMHLG